jgi:hypothetical protein
MSVRKWIVVSSIFAGLLGIASAAFACGKGGGCCGHCATKADSAKATNAKASGGKTTNAKTPAGT